VLQAATQLVNQQRFDEAYDYFQYLISQYPDLDGLPPALHAYLYADAGRLFQQQKYDQALAVIEELKERSKQRYISPTIIAFIYGGMGDKDAAFDLLEKAYKGRDFLLVLINVDPTFDSLRSDPRVADLVRRVGMT